MLYALYAWTLRLAGHRHCLWVLAGISVIESIIFPIPTDVLLMAMVLAVRERAWVIASICTVTSVIGGIIGYVIGLWLFESVGQSILNFYGYNEKFFDFQNLYTEWGGWIVFAGGLTPLPYKVITISSGVVNMNVTVFLISSLVSRGIRYFLIAGFLWYFGERIRKFIESYLSWILTTVFILVFLGFLGLRLIM